MNPAAFGRTSAPVRQRESAKSHTSCSGTMVCRASTCSTERITVEVTALSDGANPLSTASDGQGESSSFSAMKQEYLAGLPWVAWSKTCGFRPRPLIAPSLIARPTVALARNPDPHTLPRALNPSVVRSGPKSTENGAVPVVDCQIDLVTMPSSRKASHAASTTGKYSGRQPASAALSAASRTVRFLLRCGIGMSTSAGSRAVVARNSSRYDAVTGTTGSPSVQPRAS